MKNLLQALGSLGYRGSAKKAHISKQQIMYLGYVLKGGQRWLSDAHKETVLKIPTSASAKQVRRFVGTTRFCHLWILKFAELAKPLYEEKRFYLDRGQTEGI